MIANIRMFSQQLATPQFDNPKELIQWMGAIQAQDYTMAKWAIGIRLKDGYINKVEKALEQGEILRTHVMRPTWHFVAAEDIRWMLSLTAHRVKASYDSYAKKMEIPESMHTQCAKLLEKILLGNKHLTKQEIGEELEKAGLPCDPSRINYFVTRAESSGLVCSGADKNKKTTYALLDERVPAVRELHKEEALAKLARRYFSSHSPASLQDFLWWSGLSMTETRHALYLIESELIRDRFADETLFIHSSWDESPQMDESVHFLPSYDEYLISYKDRTAVLDRLHYPKAFNNYGIFHPVIAYNGKVVGNWKKVIKKGVPVIETSFFEKKTRIKKELIKEGERRFLNYLSGEPEKS